MGKQSVGLDLVVPSGVTLKWLPGSDKYVAGSDGHIYCYSKARVNARKPWPFRLAEHLSDNGYPTVSFCQGGRRLTMAVHTAVCRAFHGEKPSPIHETRHLDGTKQNNKAENLAWGTPGQNEADKRRHGRTAMGMKHGAAVLTDEAVRILRIAIPAGLWNASDAAKVFGVDRTVIANAAKGKTWKHV